MKPSSKITLKKRAQMAEFRHDPVHRRWVIVTVDRVRGPEDYQVPQRVSDEGLCPFCEGQEAKTPPEIYAVRPEGKPDTSGWKVRVFPNRYPAISGEPDSDSFVERRAYGLYDWASGVGSHDIIVDHPQHHVLFHQMGPDHLAVLLDTYRRRLGELIQDRRFRYVLAYKNHGITAGASVNHQHTQVLAMPVIPRIAAMALASAREHFHLKERCLFCDLLIQEVEEGSRVVAGNEHFICYLPYASRFPFEMCILPRKHNHDFTTIGDELIRPCAEIINEAMNRLAALFGDTPFNITIHTAPNAGQVPKRANYWKTLPHDWHWHIEIIPRLTPVAGFEWGTGMFINHTPPEDAALFLRNVEL
ncbi:MAG: DUF4921 family protein [Gemmatimonadota bacterium]|nr:DUF4921 family protein [Gemmatimonadota bacterium]